MRLSITVTQQILDDNPELVDSGALVGDLIVVNLISTPTQDSSDRPPHSPHNG